MLEGRSARWLGWWLEALERDLEVEVMERPRSRDGELFPLRGKRAGFSGCRWCAEWMELWSAPVSCDNVSITRGRPAAVPLFCSPAAWVW